MKLSKTNLFLIALMSVGAIIRFAFIGWQAINLDEQFTVWFAGPALSVGEVIIQSLSTDFTPPLYYLAAHLSMLVFGETATAIRIPSAVFGVLLIPVMYFIGKEYRDDSFGLLLAGFSTFFYSFVYYSRYGRSYSLALLLFSLAFYFFMRLLKGDKHSSIPFGLFALLSVWTHLYTCIPIGILVLYLLWERKAFSGIALLTLGSLPLLNYIFIIQETRIAWVGNQTFGLTPAQVLYQTPLYLFNYSVLIVVPIIIWSLWVHRSERIVQVITVISLVTWVSMGVLALRTPVIGHYGIWCVPLLLIPILLYFYDAVTIRGKEMSFHYFVLGVLILVIELVQIGFVYTVQRMAL